MAIQKYRKNKYRGIYFRFKEGLKSSRKRAKADKKSQKETKSRQKGQKSRQLEVQRTQTAEETKKSISVILPVTVTTSDFTQLKVICDSICLR